MMSKDDRELIERLRGLLAKATPVPWEAQGTQTEGEDRGVGIIGLRLDDAGEPMHTPTNGIVAAALPCPTEIDDNDYTRVEANAALLVAAVNALPALLTRLEALQAQPVGEDVLRRARQICADHDSDKAYQYLEGQRDDYMPMTAVVAALTASPPVVEREAIARIIAPSSFVNEGSISWNERGAGRRNALAKADAILALTPVEGVGELTRLRAALIEAGRNAGCLLADDVSTDFLMHVPEEVRLKLSTPVAQGDEVRGFVRDFRSRANQCRTNNVAYCPEAASVWDLAADALEGKS